MRLFLRLNLFYGILAFSIWGGYQLVPDLHRYIPLGVVENLLSQGESSDLSGVVIHASNVTDEAGGLMWLVLAIVGAVALMVPVSWTYLKSTADSLFIFMAVGVGLSCGVGMFLVAAVMTCIFNYTFLILWELNYGGSEDAKHYMRHSPREKERRKAKQKDTGIFD